MCSIWSIWPTRSCSLTIEHARSIALCSVARGPPSRPRPRPSGVRADLSHQTYTEDSAPHSSTWITRSGRCRRGYTLGLHVGTEPTCKPDGVFLGESHASEALEDGRLRDWLPGCIMETNVNYCLCKRDIWKIVTCIHKHVTNKIWAIKPRPVTCHP